MSVQTTGLFNHCSTTITPRLRQADPIGKTVFS